MINGHLCTVWLPTVYVSRVSVSRQRDIIIVVGRCRFPQCRCWVFINIILSAVEKINFATAIWLAGDRKSLWAAGFYVHNVE